MCEQPFSLDVLYQAIEQQIQQHLPGVQTVSFWPDIQNHIPLPAVFLEIGEIEPGQETGSGQSAAKLPWQCTHKTPSTAPGLPVQTRRCTPSGLSNGVLMFCR
ncbi:hypothetical protein [Pseudomonas bubulae]|uniref:hypothetical protein n=1 Tax=Pseudomonas bubulae TaxID=2316085 RepID=UPI002B1CFEF6|nr:hypothetical protein [Pseudomonas bubulae]